MTVYKFEADCILSEMSKADIIRNNWQEMHRLFGRGAWMLQAKNIEALQKTPISCAFFVPMEAYIQSYCLGDETAIRTVENYDMEGGEVLMAVFHSGTATDRYERTTYETLRLYYCTWFFNK
jgi:hypothetical protein